MSGFDRRLTPARPDLAAASLKGQVEARRFVEGELREVASFAAPLRARPAGDASLDTEALYGERVSVFEDEEGWAWGQLESDGYVGYLPSGMLRAAGAVPTHRVAVLRSFLYPGPSMKLPIAGALPMGATLAVQRIEGDFAVTESGSVWAGHLVPLDRFATDFVAVAEQFLGVPYLWGGKSGLGLDCSGLVQVSLAMAGIAAPRDSDMQAGFGTSVPVTPGLAGLRRGDIVCWKGHVGIMADAETLLHATGHTMLVVKEPLRDVAERILSKVERPIIAIRRPV